jgi:formylglycine-generating enzyme required for sulfatase activity
MEEARVKADLDLNAVRVSRGGGWWIDDPQQARAAYHYRYNPDYCGGFLALRLVRNTNHEGEQHEKEG